MTLLAYIFVSGYKIWLLATNKNIYWFAISNAFDYILIAIGLIVIYKFKKGQKFAFSINVAKRILSQSYHYILSGMMSVVFVQSDRIMLKFMRGNEELGLYSAACSISTLTTFVFTAIIDSMRPEILKYKGIDEIKYKKNVSRLFGLILYLSVIQSIVVSISAELILGIMYGSSYMGATSVLQILIWYTSFSYYGGVRNVWVLAEEKQNILWIVNLVGRLANIGLNLKLIPIWGINGAAFATLFTQFFTNVVLNYIVTPFKEVNKLAIKGLNIVKMIKD